MKIRPFNNNAIATYRTGSISKYATWQIENTLGFPPNVKDDPDKVKNSWLFTIDGYVAAIWDYKGSHHLNVWSIYDPHNVLGRLFVIDSKDWS